MKKYCFFPLLVIFLFISQASEAMNTRLNAACQACSRRHQKCSVNPPCDYCLRKGIDCVKSISKKRGKPSKADIAEKSRKIQATSCSFEPFLVKEEVAPAPVPGPVVTSDNNLREPAWEDLLNLSSTVDENLIPSCFFDELSIFDPEKFGPDVFSSFWHEDD